MTEAKLPEHQAFLGKSIVEIANAQGKDVDAFLDLALKEDLEAVVSLPDGGGDPEAEAALLHDPHVLVGTSDAGAHSKNRAHFGYCTNLLGLYVRERQCLSWEEAINKLTFKIASLWDIPGRGMLRPGYAADIVLFDPERVGAAWPVWSADMPGGKARYIQPARGIEMTLVNGQVLIEQGSHTGILPGQVLRNYRASAGRRIAA